MIKISVYDFESQIDCIYDEELYSVRDNGAVLRHPRMGKRSRSTDDQWTFGKPNFKNGYMYIGSVRIHRIVATAFHGKPPTPDHVVDHIDTNRRNNRPENLRWLTRLENALLNPITLKRIILICGSIEAFLEDPSRLRHGELEPNFEWMRTVNPQEAQSCRERMHLWAKNDRPSSGGGSLGEWLFTPSSDQKPLLEAPEEEPSLAMTKNNIAHLENASLKKRMFTSSVSQIAPLEELEKTSDLVIAKTPGAAQRKWRTPTEFPCCPQQEEEKTLKAYEVKLTTGSIFARNNFSTSIVLETALIDDGQSLYVMCEQAEKDAIKPWSLAKINLENELYIHTSISTFFTKEGAEKELCLSRGLKWKGGDSIDDYC